MRYRCCLVFSCSTVLCLGFGFGLGQTGEKAKPDVDSWRVTLVYQKESPDKKAKWKTKNKLTTTVGAEAVRLLDGDTPFLEIPSAGIRTVFYDIALQKGLLTELSETQGPAYSKKVSNTSTALGVSAMGAGVGIGAAASTLGVPLVALGPAAAFPPALIAVGGFVVIKSLTDDPKHFVHIIWEHEGTLQAAAIGVKKKQHDSLLAALQEVTGRECLNLPEERTRLQAEIKEQKPNRYELAFYDDKVSFGPLVLSKREETYKLILIEREESPDELYFFCPSVGMKDLAGVVLVDAVNEDGSDSNLWKDRDRRFVSTKYGAGAKPRPIQEFQMLGKRIRPTTLGVENAGDPQLHDKR